MTLLITLVLVVLVLFALFWGGTLVAQGYLYQQPAAQLPARAAAAALLVGTFLGAWLLIDQRNPGKYDTFFEFSAYTTTKFDEFEAVRWKVDPVAALKGKQEFMKDAAGKPAETAAKFRRPAGGKGAFTEEGTTHPFALNDSTMMTGAVVVKPDGGGPVRFSAVLKKDDKTGSVTYLPKGNDQRRFQEDGGGRYVQLDQPGVLYVPSTSVVVVSLLLNVLLFVVWFAAFWPVLRYTVGHALALAAVFGLATMMLLMPMLFKPNRQKPEAAVARVWSPERTTAGSRG